MIKAKDIYAEYTRKPKKKPLLDDMPPEVFGIASSDPDPYQRLVLREDMATLDKLLNDASRQLFEKIADQVPSRVIADDLEITLTALTTRIWRQRKQIQQHLKKGY